MKILIFYQYFGTPKGSWSTRIYELSRRWIDRGHEVTVVTAPYEKSDIKVSSFIEKLDVEGIKLIVINSADSNRDSTLKRMMKAMTFALISAYYALTIPTDIVISSSGPITVGIPGLLAKLLRGKRMVFEVRDLWPLGAIELGKLKSKIAISLGLRFERLCYRNADLIVPCSKGMEDGVLKVCPNATTLVIPNASDPDLFSKRDQHFEIPASIKGKSIFLYTGSLGLMDECSQIISSMEMLKNHSISLVFIGDGAERESLEKQAKATGNNNIYFLGLIPKTQVVNWLAIASGSFVTFKDIPVLHTSSPNKMFDSFAAGVPIIQSTRGWIKDLVDDKRCGINVDPSKPYDFAQAMIDLTNDTELRILLGNNAKSLAMNEFNRDKLAVAYIMAMEKLK